MQHYHYANMPMQYVAILKAVKMIILAEKKIFVPNFCSNNLELPLGMSFQSSLSESSITFIAMPSS